LRVQRIHFGLDLDGERGWHARDALGESTVGPLSFLTLLETQLGLTRAEVSRAERIVQMRECLEAVRTGNRFFEASFEADEFGTASTLLAWRDLWYLHGWTGDIPAGSTMRLLDLRAIEGVAKVRVGSGMGQRLKDIHSALGDRQPQIAAIELVDPLEELPATWRQVLGRLSAQIIAPAPLKPAGRQGTLLESLQAAFLTMPSGRSVKPLSWREDGSVRLVRAESRLAAAQWLAADDPSGSDRVVIAEQGGTLVDAALGASDQALLGLAEPSIFRPTLQVLPLVARLVWDPLDFRALLQFLTLSVGPLRSFARRRLAEKMAATPGIGGVSWDRVKAEITAHYGADAPAVLADIGFWLEHARFTPSEGLPLAFLYERIERLTAYFQKGMASDDPGRRAASVSAYSQSKALGLSIQTLMRQGVKRIGPEALDRLVSQAGTSGVDNPHLHSQAGAAYRVRSPGAVIEPFDEVCWWNLVAGPLPQAYPWSPRELRELRAVGVDLPDTGHLLERQVRGWVQGVLQARERLTLMLPRIGEEAHPAWLMLSSLLVRPPILLVEDTLTAKKTTESVTPVEHRALPALRRWWHLPPGAIHGWDRSASHSSLDQFFNNPYQWALNYPAQLKPSVLLDLPGDFQLLGNLAHRAVEQFYRQPNAISWSLDRVRQWFDQNCDRIIEEEGAVLLMRGRRADREAFRLRFRRSLTELHRLLQAAGATSVEPEKTLEAATPLGMLKGNSDLLVKLAGGGRAIIDMKWAGNGKYRKKLKEQSHTQLAIYARLIEQNSSNWPTVAYFILSQPELLTTADGVFPGVTPINVAGSSTALLWERITATWAWRRAQIEAGELEVVLEEIDETDESAPPDGALAIEPLDGRYNPFLHLAGWGVDA
jgi:PD-(D/E)XK nuclease superfamily